MSLRFLIRLAALASTCWLSLSQAMAESRIALVIGNSDYTAVQVLPNPANDAKAMAKFLSSAGFEIVQAPNLTQSDMRRTIGDFASMAAEKGPDTVALVFYAGHGLQVDGENFLVPVDAHITREADVPLQAMRLADLMNALSAVPSKTRIVILDACRNNPFSAINKTTGRGLAIVDAPNGSLVSYSTAPGTEALDGDGENSPFTAALLKVGQEPGLPIEQALKRVRLSVSESTGRQQFPWESSSLTSEFSFFPKEGQEDKPAAAKEVAAKATQPGASLPARSDARSVDSWRHELRSKTAREAYSTVIREDKVEAYQAYLALYPSQSMAPTVRTILDRRQVVIAWYTAVIINTPASYEAFLARYGSSDFAQTASRLLSRSLARSVADAGSALAYAATCPCSQPVAPAPLPRRTDLGPTQNYTPVEQGAPTGGGAPTPGTGGVTAVAPPPVIYPDPAPPPVILPPVILPGRPGYHGPRPTGGDNPPAGGGSTQNPPRGTGTTHNPPKGSGTGSTTTATGGGGTSGASGTGTILSSRGKGSSAGSTDSPGTSVGNRARVNREASISHHEAITSRVSREVPGSSTVRSFKPATSVFKPRSSGMIGMGRATTGMSRPIGFGSFGRMGVRH
ncbi:MAG TPA: caspase family protein [Xanthobacteraceae bacterium]